MHTLVWYLLIFFCRIIQFSVKANCFSPRSNQEKGIAIDQKGMTFDYDFWLFSSPFLFPPKKAGRRKAKIVLKSHAFILDQEFKKPKKGKKILCNQ